MSNEKKNMRVLTTAFLVSLGFAALSTCALHTINADNAEYTIIKDRMVDYYTSSASYKDEMEDQINNLYTSVFTGEITDEEFNEKYSELTSKETALAMMRESDYVDLMIDYDRADKGLQNNADKANALAIAMTTSSFLAISSGGLLAAYKLTQSNKNRIQSNKTTESKNGVAEENIKQEDRRKFNIKLVNVYSWEPDKVDADFVIDYSENNQENNIENDDENEKGSM